MQQWDWKAVRAFVPAALALSVAWLATWLPAQASVVPAAHVPAGGVPAWLPYAALALAALLGAITCTRLWRTRRAQGLICECGGLLGGEHRHGGRTSRTCRACGRHWRVGR